MCGIVGIVGNGDVARRLFDGLKRLEYRGYDSAGICTIDHGELVRRRAEGKLDNLARVLEADPLHGATGIAHTRWATHGAPTVSNAHPHIVDRVALVHNGIIENFKPLRDELLGEGRTFESETDTEVVGHLVAREIERGASPEEAVAAVLPRLQGAFAIAFLFRDHPDLVIGARMGAPLTVGYGDGENYLGSDALAVAPWTQRIAYLDEGDWAVIRREGIQIFDRGNQPVQREIVQSGASSGRVEKGNYRHFMQKEIFEQPIVVAQNSPELRAAVRGARRASGRRCRPPVRQPPHHRRVRNELLCRAGRQILGRAVRAGAGRYRCGVGVPIPRAGARARRAGAVHQPVGGDRRHARRASPRAQPGPADCRRGQRADQLDGARSRFAASDPCRAGDRRRLDQGLHLSARGACGARVEPGPRQGAPQRGEEQDIVGHLQEAPAAMNAALDHDDEIAAMVHLIAPARDVLYLGRGAEYPMALEGALKLKEISYIHAEGYAAGEMKHGPIALIDDKVPVIVIAPSGPLFEKTVSNMQEVRARGGKIVLISDAKGIAEAGEGCMATIEMPRVHPLIAPLVYAVPVQLLAYHTAVLKGTDVDQPRNLAKSVTVE